MSSHFENIRFNAYRGEQTSSERSFVGYFNASLVCTKALPGGGDLLLDLRDIRVTVFHNEDGNNIAISFPRVEWVQGTEKRHKSLVRADDATYAWLQKSIPATPEVKRALAAMKS